LNAAKTTEPYGFIVKPFRERDLLVTLEIAQYRHEHSRESKYTRETELMHQLERVNSLFDWKEKLLQIGKIVQQEIPFDYLSVGFGDPHRVESTVTSFLRIGFDEYQIIGIHELSMITGIKTNELIRTVSSDEIEIPGFFNNGEFEKITQKPSLRALVSQKFDMESMLSYPLRLNKGEIVNFSFYSRSPIHTTENMLGCLIVCDRP